MKIIDLLNKIANGEEVPGKLKFKKTIFIYDKERKDYIHEINDWYSETLLFKVMNCHFIQEILETKVELIEEDTIDIDSIEELKYYTVVSAVDGKFEENTDEEFRKQSDKINKLVQAVKQLNRELKELKEK